MTDMPKEILFDHEAREKLKIGIGRLAQAVESTLGPQGRNIGIDECHGNAKITNDGWSIVQALEFKDQYEDMGVSLGKELTGNIKDKCGDGTTTAIILFNTLVEKGIKNIAAGSSPIHLKKGIEKAVESVIREIEARSIPVKDAKETENIATVSASGNREVGQIIAKAFQQASVITIEEGKGITTSIEAVKGMQFNRGYVSPYFCTDLEKRVVILEAPKILITDKKISSIQDILPILQTIAVSGESLLIIAEDIEGDALSTLAINKLKGTLKICAVKAPAFGDNRKAILEDIAALTGATVLTDSLGIQCKDASPEYLGSAEKVEVTKDDTSIIDGKGKKSAIDFRLSQIKHEMQETTNPYEIEKLQERQGKLSGGIALIRVGASTELEMKQKKQIFTDSLHSTRAAQEEGIVPGGGIALLRASSVIGSLDLSSEEKIGADIVQAACLAPVKQIIANSGLDPSLIIDSLMGKEYNYGFNALTGETEDLWHSGVIDPAKIIKTGLQLAGSMASLVLLSDALVGDSNNHSVD
ncbi:MAG: chaperonin GroEL [Chlamydiales bacterium]